MTGPALGETGAMDSDERTVGHGPDDMGDDEQEFELAEYKQYIEDPPDNLVITEDDDADAEQAQDWADTHPRQVVADDDDESDDDEPAEQAAIHEIPDR
jgi:hypothetical protein